MRRQADIRIPPHYTNSLEIKKLTSSQDAGIGDTLCLLTQAKKDNKFKNKKSPELPENQTVWKYDNHRFKEETFILTGRRCGDSSQEREDRQQGDGGRPGGPTFVSR